MNALLLSARSMVPRAYGGKVRPRRFETASTVHLPHKPWTALDSPHAPCETQKGTRKSRRSHSDIAAAGVFFISPMT